MTHSPQDPEPENGPDALAGSLSRLFRAGPVPDRVDRVVAAAARERLTPAPRRRWQPLLLGAAGLAAAAGVAWMVWPTRTDPDSPTPSREVARVERWDVDGSGRVDILDALALAREIESGDAADSAWDLDGDGTVDQRDVDAVGQRAVRIDP